MNHKSLSTLFISLCLIAVPVIAADTKQPPTKALSSLQSMVVGELDDVEKKVVALAEAIPQEKYNWRPAEGVRSVSEAFMHVAQGNYLLPSMAGTKPPDGMDLMTYDKSATNKKDVVAALHASYDHARKFAKGVSDADLAKEVDFFGQKKTVRDLLFLSVEHSHGQTVAYARMNGVTPPWSK
jgi:uncharacterized damage-inducible protein DinB